MYMCQSQSPISSLPTPFPLGILYVYVSISALQNNAYMWNLEKWYKSLSPFECSLLLSMFQNKCKVCHVDSM